MSEEIIENEAHRLDVAHRSGREEIFHLVHETVRKMMSGMEYVYEIEGGQNFLSPERIKQREKIMFGIDTLIVFLETFDDEFDSEQYKEKGKSWSDIESTLEKY